MLTSIPQYKFLRAVSNPFTHQGEVKGAEGLGFGDSCPINQELVSLLYNSKDSSGNLISSKTIVRSKTAKTDFKILQKEL
jgi:hypothetical protein